MDAIQTTPIDSPIVSWVSYSSSPVGKRDISVPTAVAFAERTSFRTQDGAPDFFAAQTGPFAQTNVRSIDNSTLQNRTEQRDAARLASSQYASSAEKIAGQRIKLLAARYVNSKQSAEILARLEILNQRLLDVAPRTTKDQVASLEETSNQIERIRAAREQRAKRFGI